MKITKSQKVALKLIKIEKDLQRWLESLQKSGIDFNLSAPLSCGELLDCALDLLDAPNEVKGGFCRDWLHDIAWTGDSPGAILHELKKNISQFRVK